MHLETDGLELFLSNDPQAIGPRSRQAEPVASVSIANTMIAPVAVATAHSTVIPEGLIAIRAPNLGTFYCAPKPGAPPYVEVGQAIEPSTEVCLIEVMKLFAPVPSGVSGVVREIRARDGQMVEYDDILMLVELI